MISSICRCMNGDRSVRRLQPWNDPMVGNTVYVDPKTNRTLDPPAGYFCAIRRDDVTN